MKPVALVTGATGFLGCHLVRALRNDGYKVVGWARRPPDRADETGERFEHWPDDNLLTPALASLDKPLVFHLAAAGVMNRGDRDATNLFEGNVLLTARLLRASVEAHARAFVHVGTYTEYGIVPAGVPVRENAPLSATDVYGASKAAAGIWAQAVAQRSALGFAWARLFALYGPGEKPPRLLPSVHAALRQRRPIDLTPGLQICDWLFVGDAADGLVRLGAYAGEGKKGVFNLCTGTGLSTREVVIEMARQMEADPGLLHFGALPARGDEPTWLVGDPGAARALGWSATTEIGAGIAATIAALDCDEQDRGRNVS